MREYDLKMMLDLRANIDQIELVASFCGLRLHRVPRVADVEYEV